ncbi:MAG: general secretion pathway protein GspE, partial [Planctomycetales bacterium]
MTPSFDPYLTWLGIRDPQRPPNHYRLLGLEPFENDLDVIEAASDRQTMHIRTYQSGPRSALSQQILNELAAAKLCLLDPVKKAGYDETLRV